MKSPLTPLKMKVFGVPKKIQKEQGVRVPYTKNI